MNPSTLQEIFFLVVESGRRATTPNAIAKKVTSQKVGAADVARVIGVLRNLPYLNICETESGRINGLAFEYGKPGSCSSYYQRTGRGTTFFFIEDKVIEKIEGEGSEELSKIVFTHNKVRAHAAAHNMPFLDSLKGIDNRFLSIQPFLMEKLTHAN